MLKKIGLFLSFLVFTLGMISAEPLTDHGLLHLNLFSYSNYYESSQYMFLDVRYDGFINDDLMFHVNGGVGEIEAFDGIVPHIEAGLGVVLNETKGSGPYGVGAYFTKGGEGYIYSEKGDCDYWRVHMLEFSLAGQFLFLSSEELDYGTSVTTTTRNQNDLFLKAGYRFLSVYDALIPIQEVSLGASVLGIYHGADAKVEVRDDYTNDLISSSTKGTFPYQFDVGAMVDFSWYFFQGSLGFIGDDLIFDIGVTIRL